jgi:hypothetical protein
MKKHSILFVLAASSLLVLASCGPAVASSSSSSEKSVSASSSAASATSSTVSSSASASSSAAPSSSAQDTVIASIKVDSKIPAVKVGENLDLTPYVHFYNAANEEVPAASVTKLVLAEDSFKSKGTGTFASSGNVMLFSAEQAGDFLGTVSCQGVAADKTLNASMAFSITANSDITALSKKWSAIQDNFTLTASKGFNSQVATRTANYISYGDGKGIVVSSKDNEAYPFTLDSTGTLNVLQHDRGVGADVMKEAAPLLGVGDTTFRRYQALSDALKGQYSYFIVGAPIGHMMKNLGYDSTLISTSQGDYYLAFLGVKTTGDDYGFTAYGISSAGALANFGDFSFSAIGTSSLSVLDQYVKDGKAPDKVDVAPLINKIKTVADAHNYTIDGTADFYTVDGKSLVDLKSAMTGNAFLEAFVTDIRKPRQLMLTPDGMWMHYYNVSEEQDNKYDEVNWGYLNHTDGTVYSFTMESGKAVLGSQDVDYSTYAATKAPYWNTYKKGLASLSEERINNGSLTLENGTYRYEYVYDLSHGTPEKALGTNALDLLFPECYDYFTSSNSGTPIIENETMSFAYDDTSITMVISIPLYVTETLQSELRITLKTTAIGSTVINGLSDILSGTSEGGGEDY